MRPTTPEISGCAASPAWSSTVRSSGATTVSRTPLSGPLLLLCLELDVEAVGRGLTEVVGEGRGDRRLSLLAGLGGLLERLPVWGTVVIRRGVIGQRRDSEVEAVRVGEEDVREGEVLRFTLKHDPRP